MGGHRILWALRRRSYLARSVPIVLLALAASSVVAIAASGAGLLLPAADLSDGEIRTARILGAVAVIVGVIGLPVSRTRVRSPGKRWPDQTVAAVVYAATIMGFVTLIALFAPPVTVENSAEPATETQQEGTATNPEAPGETPPPTSGDGGNSGFEFEDNPGAPIGPSDPRTSAGNAEGAQTDFDWILLQGWARMILWLLLIALAALGIRAFRVRPNEPDEGASLDPPLPAADAEEILAASLDDILSKGGPPREQITAAYQRLLAALTEAGAPRHRFEAPHEHLFRVLGPLGVSPDPMHQLTDLYVLAQFSQQEMTDKHRASAVAALERCLEDLRDANSKVQHDPAPTYLASVPA